MMARFRAWVRRWLGITETAALLLEVHRDMDHLASKLCALSDAQTALIRDDLGALRVEMGREARDSRAVTSACAVQTRDDLVAATDQLDERIATLSARVNHLCRERTGTTAPDAIRSRPPREFTHADRQ